MDVVTTGLLRAFQKDRDLGQLSEAEAFEAFAGFCVLSSYYEAEFNPEAFRIGGGNDLSIDVYGILVNGMLMRDEAEVRTAVESTPRIDVQIVLIQAKTTSGFDTNVIPSLADNFYALFHHDPMSYPASAEVDNLRRCLSFILTDHISKLTGAPRLHIYYVTTATEVADLQKAKARNAESRLMQLNLFDEVAFRLVTARELRELYQHATEAVSARFTMVKKVPLPAIPGIEQSLMGLLPARDLVDYILTDPGGGIRKTLFHENVRDFQDFNDVNREIQATLRDPERRKRFAVFNNGITIITRELKPIGDEIHIRDFQIVNGCQTCHVLYYEREHLTDAVQVSVRIVQSRDEEIMGGIVQATNRQTAVTSEELLAREAFHKDLESFFCAQELPRRLYYERRSKQYSQRDDVEKTRIVTQGQLTRAYAGMFLVKSGKGQRRVELFRDSHHPIAYYAAAATAYRLDWLFRNRRIASSYHEHREELYAAIKAQLAGPGRLPNSPREIKALCQSILDVMWNQVAAERLVLEILPQVQKAIETSRRSG